MERLREVCSVTHQSACIHRFTNRISRRKPVPCRQSGKLPTAASEERVGSDEEGIGAFMFKGDKGRVDLADRTGVENLKLHSDGGRGFLHFPQCGRGGLAI